MKLLKSILIIVCLGIFISYSFGISFNNFPAINKSKTEGSIKGYDYIKYKGNARFKNTSINISKYNDFLSNVYKLNFFKYSYFWDKGFDNLYNRKIDLRKFQDTKLSNPIVGVGIKNNMFILIPEEMLSLKEKATIGNGYKLNNSYITNTNGLYIVRKPIENKISTNFDINKVYSILKKFKNRNLVNFQLGENPFKKYNLNGFSDKIIQIEIIKNNTLIGLIFDFFKGVSTIPSGSKKYGQNYFRDEQILEELTRLYEDIKSYNKKFGALPKDIGSLHPNFIDITAFNKYNHKLRYERLDYRCYKVKFKPKSNDFRQIFSNEINNNGYRSSKFCI